MASLDHPGVRLLLPGQAGRPDAGLGLDGPPSGRLRSPLVPSGLRHPKQR